MMRKSKKCWVRRMQKCVNHVDLIKSFPTSMLPVFSIPFSNKILIPVSFHVPFSQSPFRTRSLFQRVFTCKKGVDKAENEPFEIRPACLPPSNKQPRPGPAQTARSASPWAPRVSFFMCSVRSSTEMRPSRSLSYVHPTSIHLTV